MYNRYVPFFHALLPLYSTRITQNRESSIIPTSKYPNFPIGNGLIVILELHLTHDQFTGVGPVSDSSFLYHVTNLSRFAGTISLLSPSFHYTPHNDSTNFIASTAPLQIRLNSRLVVYVINNENASECEWVS